MTAEPGVTYYPVPGPGRRAHGWQHLTCPWCQVAAPSRGAVKLPIRRHYPARYSASWRASLDDRAASIIECACGATWTRDDI